MTVILILQAYDLAWDLHERTALENDAAQRLRLLNLFTKAHSRYLRRYYALRYGTHPLV